MSYAFQQSCSRRYSWRVGVNGQPWFEVNMKSHLYDRRVTYSAIVETLLCTDFVQNSKNTLEDRHCTRRYDNIKLSDGTDIET